MTRLIAVPGRACPRLGVHELTLHPRHDSWTSVNRSTFLRFYFGRPKQRKQVCVLRSLMQLTRMPCCCYNLARVRSCQSWCRLPKIILSPTNTLTWQVRAKAVGPFASQAGPLETWSAFAASISHSNGICFATVRAHVNISGASKRAWDSTQRRFGCFDDQWSLGS